MNFGNKIFEDFDSDHLPSNSSLQSPEDKKPEDQLEWIVDEDEDDLEEVDNDGWVAEQEADWEPPIQAAEEPAGINDKNIPMDEEDTVADLDQRTRMRRYEAELPLHQGPYITKFPIQSAGAIIDDEFMQAEHGYQSYHDKLHGNNWAPFTSRIDYKVARWAKLRGQGSTAFSDLLDIEGRQEILMAGEAFDVYFWDIIECVKALFGDPELTPYLVFAPERHYSDEDKTQRLYHEMHTGQWWWHTQVTMFRNKAVYLIYMTIRNLPKEIWQRPSHNAQILVGYLPTTKLEHITNKAARRRCLANLFHACMCHIVVPLVDPRKYGMPIASGDGTVRRGHPLIACYIRDYPEQLLVTGMKTGECPKCDIPSTELGSKDLPFELQDLDEILDALALADEDPTQFAKACRDADVLHQLYQGLVKHMISWIKSACGEAEIDVQCKRLPPNHNIQLFMKGISVLSQYPCHSDLTLMLLSDALNQFHDNKTIFVDLGIRSSFNLPKLHSFRHYLTMIRMFGTMDNYNTEYTEHLHIDLAKDAYRATNHKDEYMQMTLWLERREKMLWHAKFIEWRLHVGPSASSDHVPRPLAHSDLVYLQQPKLAKHPSVKQVTFASLADHYGAVHFQAAVARFIVQVTQTDLTARQSEDAACDVILPFQSIAVFHKVCYGTVDDDGMLGIEANVRRALFHNVKVPDHLAYVEWFTAFSATPDINHSMYRVSCSLQDGDRQASIVPVDNIRRLVHLIPKFGAVTPRDWSTSNVLDQCSTFFVNEFTDRDAFKASMMSVSFEFCDSVAEKENWIPEKQWSTLTLPGLSRWELAHQKLAYQKVLTKVPGLKNC
ncbi:uncharacterized protein EDB91DRAFT_1082859 [Suillus paluster]|uniref:uncharacterized protein n=1 Tax=Suillus paluster TaxID=48578 RepID=UPI001B873CA0|nr:uncharacterized protein EDB91DRAFT_1082859 [Suillus paluster]KAG1738098.1 hypothetical protein EDB91DRAFT_1082859 [Suillus paluster]